MKEKEYVLVVRRDNLLPYLCVQKITTKKIEPIIKFINLYSFFMDRELAEHNENYKQIIPYAVFINEDKIFSVRRLNTQSENRLHDRLSVGIGGHINPKDKYGCKKDIVMSGLLRELSEEVIFNKDQSKINLVGFISDDSNDVGRVHAGVIYVINTDYVEVREKNKMVGEWLSIDELRNSVNSLESWSKEFIEYSW